MNIFKLIMDEIFPENLTCYLCGREVFYGEELCADCEKSVVFNDGATCVKCGRRTKVEELCLECKANAPLYEKAVSALVYAEGSKKLIYAFKKSKPWLSGYLARLLSGKCRAFADAQAICYVPMLSAARRRRGYNQSQLLAQKLSKLLNIPVLKGAVIKKKRTKLQKSLTKREREENLKGSFKVDGKQVKGKTLLLVDDVLTTGATAETVTKELYRRGAKRVYFASAASVEYKTLL